MKRSEALIHLREFMLALQRYRGIVMEQLGLGSGELHLSEKMAAELWPWVWGDKCPLPVLAKMVTAGTVASPDYYNMMVILQRFMPEVRVMVDVRLIQRSRGPLPDISMQVLGGWEPEETDEAL